MPEIFRITCSLFEEIDPPLREADVIRPAHVLVRFWIVLSIILPEADAADFIRRDGAEGGVSTAGTGE
jgi:hypothetical protein